MSRTPGVGLTLAYPPHQVLGSSHHSVPLWAQAWGCSCLQGCISMAALVLRKSSCRWKGQRLDLDPTGLGDRGEQVLLSSGLQEEKLGQRLHWGGVEGKGAKQQCHFEGNACSGWTLTHIGQQQCLPGNQPHQDGLGLSVRWVQLRRKKAFPGMWREQAEGRPPCLWGYIYHHSPPHRALPASSQVDSVTWKQGMGCPSGT